MKETPRQNKFLVFLNVLAALGLLITVLGCYVNPNYFWPMSFLGFAFPLMLVLNLLCGFLWLFKKKRRAAISLIPIVLTIPFTLRIISFSIPEENEKSIKLMSYNVRSFDLYNWSHNMETREKMFRLIESEQPDILCLQEFYNDTLDFKNIATIKKRLGYPYYHYGQTVYLTDHKQPRSWGVITFSVYPIIDQGNIDFNNSGTNACIYSDIDVNDTTLRVYNMHLQSVHFGYDDYKYIDQVADKQDANMMATKRIIRKMRKASLKRAEQAKEIAASIQQSPYPVVVCGDFNDTPVSYTYQQISKGLQDAFIKKGNGFGQSLVSKIPGLRIDYVLMNKALHVHNFKTIHKDLSDHYPVVVGFGW